jgi:hypothetical protein
VPFYKTFFYKTLLAGFFIKLRFPAERQARKATAMLQEKATAVVRWPKDWSGWNVLWMVRAADTSVSDDDNQSKRSK